MALKKFWRWDKRETRRKCFPFFLCFNKFLEFEPKKRQKVKIRRKEWPPKIADLYSWTEKDLSFFILVFFFVFTSGRERCQNSVVTLLLFCLTCRCISEILFFFIFERQGNKTAVPTLFYYYLIQLKNTHKDGALYKINSNPPNIFSN